MRIDFAADVAGRLVCTVEYRTGEARLVALDPITAGTELLAAVADARDDGFGECFWLEPTGQYRWMFRATGARLAIAALWSSGTVTGWEHVFQLETGLDWFESQVQAAVAGFGTR